MATIQVYKDKAGEWRWRKLAANNKDITADSGEGYETNQGAWQAAHREADPEDKIVQLDPAQPEGGDPEAHE